MWNLVMLKTFKKLLKKRLERRKKIRRQIDIIEQQYNLLIEDYAILKSAFEVLRWRKLQLQKQIDNINEALKEED